jgi:hypothetical protein
MSSLRLSLIVCLDFIIRSTANYSDYAMGLWAANRVQGIWDYPYSLVCVFLRGFVNIDLCRTSPSTPRRTRRSTSPVTSVSTPSARSWRRSSGSSHRMHIRF